MFLVEIELHNFPLPFSPFNSSNAPTNSQVNRLFFFDYYSYTNTHTHVYVYACTYVCMYVCMHVYMYIHVCIYICIYACTYVYVYVHLCMHKYTNITILSPHSVICMNVVSGLISLYWTVNKGAPSLSHHSLLLVLC